MGLFGRGMHAEYGVILDAHSGSVGVSIVPLQAGTPQPVFTHREYSKIERHPTPETAKRNFENALAALTAIYTKQGIAALRMHHPKGKVTQALLIYGAPWATTSTRFIKLEDPVPFIVTEERLHDLIAEAERKDEVEMNASGLLKGSGAVLVERSVIHTAVNGYLVADPYGQKAHELSLAHISGLASRDTVRAMVTAIDKMAPHVKTHAHTFALAAFCVIRDRHPGERQGLIVTISAEATELSVMQDEVLMESTVIPLGTHTFTRDVAHALKTFPEEASAHIREYGEGSSDAIKKAIDGALEAYGTRFSAALADIRTRYVLPRHLFLLTNKESDAFFAQAIKTIAEKQVGDGCVFTSLNDELRKEDKAVVLQAYDAFFAIAARFFHKKHGCGELDR